MWPEHSQLMAVVTVYNFYRCTRNTVKKKEMYPRNAGESKSIMEEIKISTFKLTSSQEAVEGSFSH